MKQSAPLSKSQLGIYAECVQHENEVFYNLPFLYVFDGSIDADRLCRAIEATVQAHPTFFTRIELSEEGEPLQTIDLEKEEFSLAVEQVTDLEAEKQKFIEPFQLYGGRLFHTKVMRDAEHVYWLFDMHHIISDGSSYHIIVCDVEKAYNGGALAPEEMSMQDYALAEAEMRRTPAFEEGKQWYAQNFDCGDTFTQLMPDLEIPEHSDGFMFRTLATDMDRVDAFCKTNGIKKSTLFTSAYSFLLAKFNNEQESLFTTVFNGRTDPRFQHSVGMTVKTLPVYAKFTDDTSVLDFLRAGEEQMVGCRKHDIYSYTDIMNDLNLQTNSIFAWHGLILDFTELMGKPMQAIQLRKHNEGVSFYLMAFYVGKQYRIKAEYSSNEYSETLIDQFLESYEAVLEGFLSQTLLRDIDICAESQRTLLDGFNHTEVPYDDSQTIVSMFRQQVAKTPDNIAVVYRDKRFTYKELDELSDRIATYIHAKGLHQEDVVSVLIPRCEWMPIVSLGIVKAGCAYQPLDPTYPSERLNFMMQDANAKLLIAEEELRSVVDQYQGEVLFTKDIMSLSAVSAEIGGNPKPDSLFILLYTSGTTGTPKGCQLEHRNLVAFCEWYHRRFNLTSDCKVTAYASYGFDANMMETYPCLTAGATLHIIPEELRLDLLALNEYFEKEQITHGFMTTQVAYQFATSIENHSLRHLLTGGEKLAPLTPPTNYTLVNLYGPTESTVCITSFDVTKPMKDIPIGAALDNVKLYIVDKGGHRLPVGAAGELWVAGPQVTRGYLNRPEKTAEVYIDNPFAPKTSVSGDSVARVYRTGDIVRYLPDGNIQFVGRKDGQVKIRGFRIELKEVEGVILQFPGIKDATVQAFDEEGGGKFIAAYVVSDETVDIQALNNFIMEEKPPYMVPAVTMQIERIPLNQNQKVNKKALPKPEKKAAEAVVESNVPMNVLEQEIHGIIAKIINSDDFGVTTPLGYAGLTSIMAIKLAIQINKRFGVTLDSKSLAKTGTLQSIENECLNVLMRECVSADAPNTQTIKQSSNQFPLSYAQTGVYVECIKQPEATVYNIPVKIRLPKAVDTSLLAKALETLVKTHPQLQTHFGSSGSDIVQIIDLEQPIEIPISQHSEAEMEQYKREFVKPFNLRQGPLYRMEIVTTDEWVYLLLDFHHLVMDGGSLDLFLNQLCDLMNEPETCQLEPETITYADFVAAEKAAENSEKFAAARDFFQQRLGNVEGVTEVPSDLTNPKEQGVIETVNSPLDFDAIGDFCRQHNISPAHLTLAATFYTLSRFTNNEQLCITTISNGRSDLRISNTVGMFVNTLALSATIGEQTVLEFLDETSRLFDETLRHEYYPFAQIATDYDLSAEIMFAYQMGVIDEHKFKGQPLTIENMESDTPKFRIAFYITNDEAGRPCVSIEYDNGRYSRDLMQHLAQSVCNAAKAFIRQPELGLQQVSLLDADQTAILDSFNQTDVPYDDTQTIVSLFRRQVELTPDNMAVVYHDNKYTYREVDAISERIAAYLVAKGLGREDVVSVLIPRCEWMAIASLGVLKACCAYQPLDPSYPSERLNFMVKDANAKLLIADEELRPIVDEYQGEVLLTKEIQSIQNIQSTQNIQITPDSLFILLYTSGSTGTPKGCQLEHRNLVAFCHWYQKHYGLTANDKVAAYASYGFDACMMDLYPALTCGACVHIIGDDIRLNLPDLNDYFNQQGITHSFITTQVGYQFATNVENHSLRCFAVGGEKLSALNPPTNYKMYNGYGPTECTIFTTNYWVKDYELDIPIGKPLDNLKLYIVDKQFNRLPIGAMGELWVAGPQVSRGYLNRPEKTAEVFIDNPFAPKTSVPGDSVARVYRTGDIVRYLPDGNIQFVGRKDGQVKIRGFRIELKEVEAVIRQFPGIKDATVQAFDYENGGKYIAAYIVSDEKVDIKQLNDFIGQQKPPYMIPAATMQIDAIPLNQNQKVNRKALPTPVIQAADHEYVEPTTDTEKLFCKIFADILSIEKIGATDNFFELGGTSLMVTRVIIEADKAGHHIAYGDVFANPTPRLLSKFLTGGTIDEDEEARDHNYGPINHILEGNTLDAFRNGERQPIGNVLLTGATGFLGIHVLKELIDRDDVPAIWCMVRAESQEKAERRLKGLLFYYFNRNYKELFGTRLLIVNGDVTQDIKVDGEINTVFNCAAVVKHFSKGTEIEDVNVGGAVHCVQFCLQNNARLIHISTYSTAGMSVNGMPSEDTVYTEQKLYFGQNLGNQYSHSKFISERVVLDAIALHKLNAKVMRVGNLAPRSSDGEFQINFQTNSAMGRIRVYQMLGCYPYGLTSAPMEFSPINEVAKAIVLLSETPKECCLFHPFNDHHVHFGDVLAELSKVASAPRQVEDEAFGDALEVAKQDPDKAKLLSSLIAYEDMAHGQKAVMIPTENKYTSQVLYRLGFRWSSTSWDYVDQMLETIAGLGYFDL